MLLNDLQLNKTSSITHVNAGEELFQRLVELKLKEAPQGVTATFDRKWITAGATATLKVAVAKGKVLPGSYKLTVEGEAAIGGDLVRWEVVTELSQLSNSESEIHQSALIR